MKINGKDISLFGAKLVNYSLSGASVTNHSSEQTRYGIQNRYFTQTANKTITVQLVFKPTWFSPVCFVHSVREKLNKVTEQISSFDAELLSGDTVTLSLPNGFDYICVPQEFGSPEDDGSAVFDSTYVFLGIQVRPMLNVTPIDGVVSCMGNTQADCVITITANTAVSSASVFGVTIKFLQKNDIVVIDGIKKTVLCNGENKFSDVDLTEFPFLNPGENKFSVFPSNALTVTVSYYPTYI